MTWYPKAGEWLDWLIGDSGWTGTRERAAAVAAAFSANTGWSQNMFRAENFFRDLPVTEGTPGLNTARRVLIADDPIPALHQDNIRWKTINFAHAILGDDPRAVAVDRWAARIAMGTDDADAAGTALGRVGAYDKMADAYRDAAAQLGLKPSELQAITWVHAVPPDSTVRDFKANGEWGWAKTAEPKLSKEEERRLQEEAWRRNRAAQDEMLYQARQRAKDAERAAQAESASREIAWEGPKVAKPMPRDSATGQNVTNDWASAERFDDIKDRVRQGARDAQLKGYTGFPDDFYSTHDLQGFSLGETKEGARLEGGEIVSRAVHSEPTTEDFYRGIRMTPDDVRTLMQQEGHAISLPLSSFMPGDTGEYNAKIYASGKSSWISSSVPDVAMPVVIKLEPGARLAPMFEPANPYAPPEAEIGRLKEHVGFGQFQVLSVDVPKTGEKYTGVDWSPGHTGEPVELPKPVVITVRQTSMLEDIPSGSAPAERPLSKEDKKAK